MDTLAQCDGLTPRDRGAKARPFFEAYAAAHPGAQIIDLVINLAHLADEEGDKGGAETLRDALWHHESEQDLESPAPGTEYPFSVSDIARAVAKILGQGWSAEAGYWGTSGTVSGPYLAEFEFVIDCEGDLCIQFDGKYTDDDLPEDPELPHGVRDYDEGVYLEGACSVDGVDHLAERAAAAILAVTGYDPADFDFESSASRQHHIDTGRYLRKGQAEEA